jgi:hypothetical protein
VTKCRWCGMDSSDDYTCEWCKRQLKPRPPHLVDPFLRKPGPPAGPGDEGLFLPGETPTPAPPAQPSAPQPPSVPADQTQQQAAAQAPPTPTSPPQAAAPAPQRLATTTQRSYALAAEEPWGVRLERFLALGMPLLLVGTIVISLNRGSIGIYIAVTVVVMLLSGIVMPATRVVGFFDDEYRDVMFALLATLCFGPFFGSLLYLAAFGGLSRVLNIDFSSSVFGLMGWLVVASTVLALAYMGLSGLMAAVTVGLAMGLSRFGGFTFGLPYMAIWLGWFFGGFFRPLNR